MLGERFEKQRQRHRADRFIAHDRIGFDLGVMAACDVRGLSFASQELTSSDLGVRIIEAGIEDQA